MFTPVGVVLIGLGFLVACLITIYLYVIRINSRNTIETVHISDSNIEKKKFIDAEKNAYIVASTNLNHGLQDKKTKKEKKRQRNLENSIRSSVNLSTEPSSLLPSPSVGSQSFIENDEEDDILALASLRGHDISNIRRRKLINLSTATALNTESESIVKFEKKENHCQSSTADFESSISLSSLTPQEPAFITEISLGGNQDSEISTTAVSASDAEFVTTEIIKSVHSNALVDSIKSSDISYNIPSLAYPSSANEWTQVPTKEDEAVKVAKNKFNALKAEFDEIEHKFVQSSRNLEQSQKRIVLLEQELKEQRKITAASKSSNEAQIVSLRAINHEMASKLSKIESGFLDASIAKNESERAKDLANHLQSEILRMQDEKKDLLCHISEMRNENDCLSEKASRLDPLNDRCKKLEEELDESRRALSIEIEAAQINLKKTLVNLENEISSHRAEHANSVGSSTALHQEIAQLKIDIRKMIEKESKDIARIEELELEISDLKIAVNKITTLEANIIEIQTERDSLKIALAEKNLEFESMVVDIQATQINLENKTQELESVKLKLYSSVSCNENAQKEIVNGTISAQNLELEALKSELNSLKSEIDSLRSLNDPNSDIEFLRTQLAESEIQINGLKSDVAREIKRANVSKIVYESKLAALQNKN